MMRRTARFLLTASLLILPALLSAAPAPARTPESDVRPRNPAEAGPRFLPPTDAAPPSRHLDGSPLAEFSPAVDEIVNRVSLQRSMSRIAQLSGHVPILVAGEPETLVTRYTHSPLNVVAADWLKERFESMGYDVELQWFTWSGSMTANVVATKTGALRPDDVYVIGAHYDCTSQSAMSNAPGANDNASGTAVVLEAATVLASAATEATVKFVCFSAEEQGLVGSTVFVERALAAGENIIGAVTLDMVAYWNASYAIQIEGGHEWEWLMNVMAASCDRYTSLGWVKTWYSWGSDHVPFQDAGIPAFLAIEDDWDVYGCYHRICDTYDIQDYDIMYDVTRSAVGALASLAGVMSTSGVAASEETAPAGAAERIPSLVLGVSPNPVPGAATILLDLPAAGAVEIALFDVAGRRMADVARLTAPRAGASEFRWIAPRALPDGIYFLRADAVSGASVQRIVIAR
jgi:hypothetical protein